MRKAILILLSLTCLTCYCYTPKALDTVKMDEYGTCITGLFKIIDVVNYHNIYVIDASIDNTLFKIISPKSGEKTGNNINIGETYNLTIINFNDETSLQEIYKKVLGEIPGKVYFTKQLQGLKYIASSSQDSSQKIPLQTTLINNNIEGISGIFKIESITKQNNAYLIYASLDSNLYKIASPVSSHSAHLHKIKVGESYFFTIFSYKDNLPDFWKCTITLFEVAPGTTLRQDEISGNLYYSYHLNGDFLLTEEQVRYKILFTYNDLALHVPTSFYEGSFKIDKIQKNKSINIIYASKGSEQFKIASPVHTNVVNEEIIQKDSSYHLTLVSYKNDYYSFLWDFLEFVEFEPGILIKIDETMDLFYAYELTGLFYRAKTDVWQPKN